MNLWKFLSAFMALVILSGCVYKMDIQQGNDITPEQADQLQLGMTEGEVRAILGTPLLQDPLSPGRWDYVYQLQQKGEVVKERRLTVFFDENQRLVKIEKIADR